MNKKILLPLLSIIAIVLAFFMYKSIKDEMVYQAKVEDISKMVQSRLDSLRKMELAYRDVHGEFTADYDKLFNFMKNGKYYKIKEIGNSDGEVVNVKRDTTFLNPLEVVFGSNNVSIDHMKMVPPNDTAVFTIYAGKISQGNVSVPNFEIKDPYPFNKEGKVYKVGDKSSAVTSGNWR